MFDDNSGSPTDRQREKGRPNSTKIETRRRSVEDERRGRSVWKMEEQEEQEEQEEEEGEMRQEEDPLD